MRKPYAIRVFYFKYKMMNYHYKSTCRTNSSFLPNINDNIIDDYKYKRRVKQIGHSFTVAY